MIIISLLDVDYCPRLRRAFRVKLGVNTWCIARLYVYTCDWTAFDEQWNCAVHIEYIHGPTDLFIGAKFMYSCVAFRFLRKRLNVWLYYATFVCCLMAISRRWSPPSVIIRHAKWPWAPVRRPLGWPLCPLNAPSSLPGYDAWSPENLHYQPVGYLFRSWLALSLCRRASVTVVHACIAALHGLQINCATLKWLSSSGHTQTWLWARALFSRQKLLEILVSVIW